jgi:hypothetical protein
VLQTVRGKPNPKTGEGPVDPDELQLMDECNERWVQAWRQATAHPDTSAPIIIRTDQLKMCIGDDEAVLSHSRSKQSRS